MGAQVEYTVSRDKSGNAVPDGHPEASSSKCVFAVQRTTSVMQSNYEHLKLICSLCHCILLQSLRAGKLPTHGLLSTCNLVVTECCTAQG